VQQYVLLIEGAREHAVASVPGSALSLWPRPVVQGLCLTACLLGELALLFAVQLILSKSMAMPHAQVDAFANRAFQGNPAAVCLLDASASLDDSTRQSIAAEMCLSETAFVEAVPPGAHFATAECGPWFQQSVRAAL
jgi:hypothetical protein